MDLGVQIEPQFGFKLGEILAIANEAGTAGFTRLWVSDHLFLGRDAVNTDCLEAWTLLAALAVRTEGIRIGPMVTAQSYRNPALLAKIAAGVDIMSGGRLDFGIGAGWKEVEYRAYGYEFPDAPARVTQMSEALEICTRMWKEERATYHGKHYRIDDALCSPKPAQRPLPIWIGGTKPRVMRIAAKYAHWFNMSNPSTPARERITAFRQLDEACRSIGRDPATLGRSLFIQVLAAPTRREIDELASELGHRSGLSGAEWLAARPGFIAGTADEVGQRLREIAAAGIGHANVMFPYGHEIPGIRALREVARAI
ncbi:MAG TPA: TIGR03560 family F420-dependent LLM class oxidoreductase [Candidatus Limnocylindria bacterium]|nr:TIGR03560 family F420-dependent LLM class oxidoreductase [Candidatus Limnocylindria bacterium]